MELETCEHDWRRGRPREETWGGSLQKILPFFLFFSIVLWTRGRRLESPGATTASGIRPSLGGIQLLLLQDPLLSLPGGLLVLKHSSLLLQLFVLGLQVPLHLLVASLQLQVETEGLGDSPVPAHDPEDQGTVLSPASSPLH